MKARNVIMFALLLIVLTACSPMVQGFVDLPETQENALTGIFIAVVALGLDWLIGKWAWLSFFLQYREAWSLALAALGIKGLENALPTGSDAVSIPAVGLLIAVLVFLLGRMVLKRSGVKSFQ